MMPHTNYSATKTITIEELEATQTASSIILKLRHKEPKAFLQEMAQSNVFNVEQQQQIHDYIEIYNEDDAPLILSLFISEIIWPALLSEENADLQDKLGKVEDYVKERLKTLLPIEDIDVYIQENAFLGDEGSDFEKECEKTDNYFQGKKEQIYEKGDQCYQDMMNALERLKKRLFELVELKESISNESQKRQQLIDEKIVDITKELLLAEKEFHSIGDQIVSPQKVMALRATLFESLKLY